MDDRWIRKREALLRAYAYTFIGGDGRIVAGSRKRRGVRLDRHSAGRDRAEKPGFDFAGVEGEAQRPAAGISKRTARRPAAWGCGRGHHHHRGWGRSNELVRGAARHIVYYAAPSRQWRLPGCVGIATAAVWFTRFQQGRRGVRKRPGVMARELWRETARQPRGSQ